MFMLCYVAVPSHNAFKRKGLTSERSGAGPAAYGEGHSLSLKGLSCFLNLSSC